MPHWEVEPITLTDRRGQIRDIPGCSLSSLRRVRYYYEQLWIRILDLDPEGEINFKEACEKDSTIEQFAIKIIEACGIKQEWVNFPILAALVHSYIDKDGVMHRGFIREKYLPVSQEPIAGPTATFDENYANIYAAVLGLTESVSEAKEAIENIPADDLGNLLSARAEQIKLATDDKAKRKKDMEESRRKFEETQKKKMMTTPPEGG